MGNSYEEILWGYLMGLFYGEFQMGWAGPGRAGLARAGLVWPGVSWAFKVQLKIPI